MANLSIKSTSFQTDVINSAYGDSLSQGYDYWKNIDLSSFDNSIEFAESNLQVGFDDLMRNMRIETEKFYDSFDNLSWGDKSAIKDMWAKIEPDQDVLKNTAEKYIEAGETIPDSVRKGILDSAKVGAAIDDQESLYTLLAYNASLNNPEYANMILNAKKSGMDIPEEMILGIALAKPELLTAAGIIAEDTKDSLVESTLSGKSEIESASREAYIEAVLNGMDSQKSDIVRKASELAQLAIASFKGDLSGTAIDLPDNVEGPLMTGARTSLNIKTNALGGIYDSPILTWVAEAGDAEAIIPLNQTQRAYDLWLAAGEQIGVSRSDSILTETSSMYTETNNSIINNASEKIITIKLEGGAELKIPKGTSQQELLELLDENLMPMLINKLNTEIFEGGDEVFDT